MTILCYGDSNTWGYIPNTWDESKAVGLRFSFDKRWVGVLQKKIGKKGRVIDEGLPGRTTNLDDPTWKGRNGKSYLLPCLESHSPLQLVILMLGTNDLKMRFQRSSREIANGASDLIKTILAYRHYFIPYPFNLLLVSPPPILKEESLGTEFKGALSKAQTLDEEYFSVSKRWGCHFFKSRDVVKIDPQEGVHLTEEDHLNFGTKISEKVLAIL